ncbi:hypothetical protein OIU77_027617 [Salix suchowensis]|uniref:Dormancy/auxin associated family protein n=1 Tax=Salix suchowensis TaxID=1278906 RepID=A0ABQ9BT27_9ROSI|nr:hypothetical protein OIU77_027617 [Salix suchowensis]
MEFLHKLWNETLAGPMPDSGLGELRKYDSFSARSSPPADAAAAIIAAKEMNITRSITIVRTNCSKYLRSISVDPCSAPKSPSTPSTPTTPLTDEMATFAEALPGEAAPRNRKGQNLKLRSRICIQSPNERSDDNLPFHPQSSSINGLGILLHPQK